MSCSTRGVKRRWRINSETTATLYRQGASVSFRATRGKRERRRKNGPGKAVCNQQLGAQHNAQQRPHIIVRGSAGYGEDGGGDEATHKEARKSDLQDRKS